MRIKKSNILSAIVLACFFHAANAEAAPLSKDSCDALIGVDFSPAVGAPVTVTKAAVLSGSGDQPEHCHILATISPSTGVEIQLPLSDWNERLLFTGCGGLCGLIRTNQGADALARNYAVATTDMGHSLKPGEDPREWTLNDELVEEWQHRATHRATRLAKAVIESAYGRAQNYAYFRGCSTGGRQGLTEALMYTDDYDGIIAGAPAAQMVTPHNVFAYASNTRPDGTPILTVDAITLLSESVLDACDIDDGLKDEVVGNPLQCSFKPESLLCESSEKKGCLTQEQIDAAKKVYDGARRADGTPFYAMGYTKGSERDWIAGFIGTEDRGPRRAGSAQFTLERKIGPDATLADFQYAKHGTSGSPVGGLLDFGPDGRQLEPFIQRGGKILLYHGWTDTDATPASSFYVYNTQVQAFGEENVPHFLRMFMMPGMNHCRGGNGVNTADYLDAIERWVEDDIAPESLDVYGTTAEPFNYIAHPLDPETIKTGRRIYPYPATSIYHGTGDPADPKNWVKQ